MRLLFILLAGLVVTPAMADGPRPMRVGACVKTTVADIGSRLGEPGSGSAARFANGIIQISYDQVPALDASRVGDPVRLCLVSVPQNCPKGDDRGKIYKATNLRTQKSWTLADAQHSCGGA